ncbi:MAG: hypothetical protein IJZ16_03155, partial [Clostridia bacterium]|nr:hypothetical protein [Clostridia bacterium]
MNNSEIIGDLKGIVGTEGTFIEVQFHEKVTFDTVVIKEKNNQIFKFSIWLEDESGEYKSIYKQERIGEYRYCEIGEHTADSLKICIESSNESQYNLKSINVLNVENNKNESFRVTSYIVCPGFYYDNNVDTDKLQTNTDVILFGIARFDENGSIYYENVDETSGEDVLRNIVAKLRKINPDLNIYCNILGPDGSDADDKETLHSQAFINNGDALSNNILSMVKDFGFDGIFFDYEYPYKAKSRRDYSKFLVNLNSVMGEYKIGVALAEWNCDLSKKAIDVIDRVEIMAYDDMSVYNQHSEFASKGGILAIKSFEKKGYDLSKCDLGLPFYGRTHGGEEAWPSYAQISPDLENNPFKNVIAKSYLTGDTSGDVSTSFNGVQMIKDKTAFANDYGLGGVMVWHYSCDVPYEN